MAWGTAIALAGLAGSLWLAALLFAVAGAADSVSAVCRTTINQTVTPDRLRGRTSSVYSLVVTGAPRLGDIESGAVAGLAGARFSVVSGGLAGLVGVLFVLAAFPALKRLTGTTGSASPSARRRERPARARLEPGHRHSRPEPRARLRALASARSRPVRRW